MSDDTDLTVEQRIQALEKRLAEVLTLLHFQDAMRVKIEKSIGAIDQQLIKTDGGLHQVRKLLTKGAGKAAPMPVKPAAKVATKVPAKAKAMVKATKKSPVKGKASATGAAKKRR